MEQIEAIQEGLKGVCRLPGPGVPLSGLLWPPPLGPLAGRGRRPGLQQARPPRLLLADGRPALFRSHYDVPAEQEHLRSEGRDPPGTAL